MIIERNNLVEKKVKNTDNRDLEFLEKFKVDKPKPSITNFACSNIHMHLKDGTVIESPELALARQKKEDNEKQLATADALNFSDHDAVE